MADRDSTTHPHEVYGLFWPVGKRWFGVDLPGDNSKPVYHHYQKIGVEPTVRIVARYKTADEAEAMVNSYYAANANHPDVIHHEL